MTQPAITTKRSWKKFEMDPEPIEDGMQQQIHIDDLITTLREHFRNQPDAFVSAAGFIFWNPDNTNERVAPDCFIARNVNADYIWTMPNYLLWEAGKPPDWVLEVASPSTARRDRTEKRDLYARLGIPEYWRLDPTGGQLYGQPVTGEVLTDGQYQSLPVNRDQEGNPWVHSPVLNLDFTWNPSGEFQISDSETGERLLSLREERQARLTEQQARLAAEAELARLRGQLDNPG